MKTIAIQDANIMIDLVRTGLFGLCMALDYHFITTDIILAELYDEQIAALQPHIDSGKFVVVTLSEKTLYEIQLAAMEDTRLSEQDWSAVYFAQKENSFLLSGDKYLRAIAEAKAIVVRGILWILDELVEQKHLQKQEAADFLNSIMNINPRLPKTACDQRLKDWGSGE